MRPPALSMPLRRPLQQPPSARIYPPLSPPPALPQMHHQLSGQSSHIPLLQPQPPHRPQINSSQKAIFISRAVKQQQDPTIDNNNGKWSRQQPLGSAAGGTACTGEVIYESLACQSHIYEVIDSGSTRAATVAPAARQLAPTPRLPAEKPKVPPRNGSKSSSRPQPRTKPPPMPAPRRVLPVGGGETHPTPQMMVASQPMVVGNQTTVAPHVLQPNVLKYFQQKLYESFGNSNVGGQPQKAALEAVCTSVEMMPNKSQRIDAMLETAQFLATAAYLER